MERVHINGVELEFEVRGSGESVMLVHGNILADCYAPLLEVPSLMGHYRIIRYHRCGFAGSTHLDYPVSTAQQAVHCRALMRHLNVERAHVVGYHYGGVIALQLALDAPDTVHSLSLLGPLLVGAIPSGQQFWEGIALIQRMYEEGQRSEVANIFFRSDLKEVAEPLPQSAFEQVVADMDTFFRVEMPALRAWNFTREDAGHIRQPVLSVLGANSPPMFQEMHKVVLEWLPQAEEFVLPNATHLLQMMNPQGMAKGLAGFFTRHPLQLSASDLFPDETDNLEDELREIIQNYDEWLNTPNDQFDGRPPKDLIPTQEKQRLRDMIRAVKHGTAS